MARKKEQETKEEKVKGKARKPRETKGNKDKGEKVAPTSPPTPQKEEEKVKKPRKNASKKPKKPQKVKPLIKDGKEYCPVCQERKWEILEYGVTDKSGIYKFKAFCKDCFVIFEYEKGI